MKNHVCWDRDAALQVINTSGDVDAQPDAIFRAVHTDVPIRYLDSERRNAKTATTQDILRRILKETDFALVPVIGEAGTGKSHLVRWLNLMIKRDRSREVVFVRKSRTNLRDVLLQLIERLPEESQEQYQDRLRETGGGTLTKEAQRVSILNNIQIELTNEIPDPGAPDYEERKYLLGGLRDLLIDPYFRQEQFLKDGGFAADLAAHVYERPSEYNPAEQRRVFTADDIPREVMNIRHAAQSTRGFLQFLLGQGQDIADKAASIVNRHLDAAITRCLNFSGDHLIQIMREIRTNMKKDGQELILLIEDFARLQGLDRALLQSILDQGDEEICALRTVFACTTGYYGSLENTVRTRSSFVIDMDNQLGEQSGSFRIHEMVARYLNAARLGVDRLNADWDHASRGEMVFEIESACDECEHKLLCHATFGHEKGYGLYPFTRQAVDIMARRADANVETHFNPREFQKQVLRPVTELTEELSGGRFPPRSLLESLGGLDDFDPHEQQVIRKQIPNDANRYLTLISLWAGETQAVNLEPAILNAFSLTPLLDAGEWEPTEPVPPEAPPGIEDPDQGPVRIPEIATLGRWANGAESMSQQLANDLRPLVFETLGAFINWDEVGFAKPMWIGANGQFKQNGVIFRNQTTRPRGASLIQLDIPANWDDDRERTETYSALSGLLEAKRAGGWAIPDANRKFVNLQERLTAWSEVVVARMNALRGDGGDWHPASAALELLVLGALLTTPQVRVPDKVDLVEIGLGQFGEKLSYASQGMYDLVAMIRDNKDMLERAVREGASATKGGRAGNFLNSNRLVEAMKALRGRGYYPLTPPDGKELRVLHFREVRDLAKRVHDLWDNTLQKEAEMRLQWLMRAEEAFASEPNEEKIAEIFLKSAVDIATLGIPGTSDMQMAAQRFRDSNFSNALQSVKAMQRDEKLRPWHLAAPIGAAIKLSDDLINCANKVLARAEREVSSRLDGQGYNPEQIGGLVAQIEGDITVISQAMEEADDV